MWSKSRISSIILNSILSIFSFITLVTVIIIVSLINHHYDFLPWNITVMFILIVVASVISLITGILGLVGSIFEKKVIVLITLISTIFSAAVITFIGLYSLSGIIYPTETIEMGWNKLNSDEIEKLETHLNCHGLFNNGNNTNNSLDYSQDINEKSETVPFCIDVLQEPFVTYSSIMFGLTCCMYILLVIILIVISKYIVKDKILSGGFLPIE